MAEIQSLKTRKFLQKLVKKQLPFAIKNSLNEVAFEARKEIQKHISRTYTNRNKWTIGGVLVTKATKKKLVSVVYHRSYYMEKHELGAPAFRGNGDRRIAIPLGIRKNKKTIVRFNRRPNAILNNANVFKNDEKGYIFRQTAKKLKILYLLRKTVKIKPTLKFAVTTRKVFDRKFVAIFNKQLRNALLTAK